MSVSDKSEESLVSLVPRRVLRRRLLRDVHLSQSGGGSPSTVGYTEETARLTYAMKSVPSTSIAPPNMAGTDCE